MSALSRFDAAFIGFCIGLMTASVIVQWVGGVL